MDAIALALVALAALVFLIDFVDRRTPPAKFPNLIPLGLFLLAVGLICQFTHLSTTIVRVH